MPRVYLLRHGQRADFTKGEQCHWDSAWPNTAQTYEDPDSWADPETAPWRLHCCDAPLTATGREQARAAGKCLPDDVIVYTSPFHRCRETAQLLDKGVPIPDNSFTEQMHPDWFGHGGGFEYFEKHHRFPHRFYEHLPSDPLREPDEKAVRLRSKMVYDHVSKMDIDKPLVFVSHGGFIAHFLLEHSARTGRPCLMEGKGVRYCDLYCVDV